MPQLYLSASEYFDQAPAPGQEDVYATSFARDLLHWVPPKCPFTSAGGPQLFNPVSGKCSAVPADVLNESSWPDVPSGVCGPPHVMAIRGADGECFSRNDCWTAVGEGEACLNGQVIRVSK